MSLLEAAVVYEELGRSLVPTPHFVSSVLSGGALTRRRHGRAEGRVAAPHRQRRGHPVGRLARARTTATRRRACSSGPFPTADGVVLSGTKRHVAFASSAERLVVLARTGDAPTDIDLFLVDPTAPGVVLTQKTSISSDTQYDVELTDVHVPASDRIGAAGSGWATWNATMLDGIVLAAAQAAGGAQYALEITVQYAKDREQFDKPLGAFQALAHYLADAKTNVDGATLLVYEAAWAAANGHDTSRLAPMAKLFACKTYRDVTAMAQQIFGGVGFTIEYDIQLYFRRAKQLQLSWWDDRELEDRVAVAVLD